jgi:hypothetical protein
MGPEEFEEWLYANPDLEAMLGETLYMAAIETRFRDRESVYQLRRQLRDFALANDPSECHCIRHPDLAVIDMGHHKGFIATLETRRKRGGPYWWLSLEACRICGQSWLYAQEERHNDVYILRRLRPDERDAVLSEGVWPPDFDRYETLLKIGREAGCSVTYMDPLHSSLVHTARDLISDRPDIQVSELALLLNVSSDLAAALARKARKALWKLW